MAVLLLAPILCFGQTLAPPFDDAANWLSYDRDNTARRYSPLDQIRPENIKRLAVSWVAQFPRIPNRSEATPLVRNGVMYVTAGGEEAHAIDARTGRLLWTFRYTPPGSAAAPRLNWNRGFALSGNRLFMATTDCSLIAIDARNGSLLWRMQLADPKENYGTNAAPLVVKNLVLLGVRGGDLGRFRGFLDAYEVETGRRAWRYYTIPAPGEAGAETWPQSDTWKFGGGATWTPGSYDPELNLVYWPVGNPGPRDFDGRNRTGDNLYTCALIALHPETGKRAWHYQFTPHDTHDWDANETLVLADAVWKGKPRKLIMQANRNAFFYVLDRTNGELLLAEPFAKQTWAKRILPDGKPELMPNTEPTQKGNPMCPDVFGGTNWQGPAYNPGAGLFYVVARDACGVYKSSGFSFDPDPKAVQPQVSLKAIDIQTGVVRWTVPYRGNQEYLFAGAMTTAGGLVFFSSREGQFMAADAKTGAVLWHFYTGGTIRASPMSYAVDGKQYVAITTKGGVFAFALPEESAQPAGSGRVVRLAPEFDDIVAPDVEIEKVAAGFTFIEGPVWLPQGFLLFSDVRANRIMRWSPIDGASVFREHSGIDADMPAGKPYGSNGLTIDRQGRVTMCQHGERRIVRIEKDGTLTVLADRFEGKRLNSPNDLVYKSDGALYFSDPPYGLFPGYDKDPRKELPFSGVFRLAGGKLECVYKDLPRPNGLAFSPDEKYLYVANSEPPKKLWMRFEVKKDGGLGEGKVFFDVNDQKEDGLPDGMKVDRLGNVYCAGPGGIWVFSPSGKHIGSIQPTEIPANCAWGGQDGKDLFMTARTGLYRVHLKVEGIRP